MAFDFLNFLASHAQSCLGENGEIEVDLGDKSDIDIDVEIERELELDLDLSGSENDDTKPQPTVNNE